MSKQQTIRVGVSASSNLDEVKLAAIDMFVMLNRMFLPRGGGEFAASSNDATGEGLAVVLFWRRFDEYTAKEFRMAMEGMRNRQRQGHSGVCSRTTVPEVESGLASFRTSHVPEDGLEESLSSPLLSEFWYNI